MKYPRTTTLLCFTLCLCFSLCSNAWANASSDDSAEPLNVVLVEVDDLHYEVLGFMGDKVVKTPHLDRLASQGTVFKNCIVQGTACSPSRNSLITGSYPHNTGIYMNASDAHLKENTWTFPKALQRAGVETALIGKNHFRAYGFDKKSDSATKNKVVSQQLGFGHVFSLLGKVQVSENLVPAEVDSYAEYLHKKGVYPKLVKAYGEKKIVFPLEEEDYLDAFIANNAVEWITQRAKSAEEKPFFLWVDLTLPHPPMDAPKPYGDLYAKAKIPAPTPTSKVGLPKSITSNMKTKSSGEYRRGYYALISMMDAQIGKIINSIEENGLRENTVILFFSDHGSMIGNHGLYSKKYFYKDVINSPLVISHPKFAQGKVVNRCVELLDISKTLLAMNQASKEDLDNCQGISLLPLLTGQGDYDRKYAHAEQHGSNMIQGERFKLVEYEDDSDVLFDLENDPSEMDNVIDKHPEIAKQLRQAKKDWLENSGPVLPSVLREE